MHLSKGDDFQEVINTYPIGTTFEIQPGIHRGQEIIPREGDTIAGAEGVVLSGAELLQDWRFEHPYWVHDGPHSKTVPDDDPIAHYWELRARWPHDLFVDDIPLIQKHHPGLVTDESSWHYDYEEDRIYVRFPPVRHKMELSGLCRYGLRTSASGVTVRNVHFDKYATLGQSGAVELGPDALVEHCIVTGSHATGIRIRSNTQVRQCRFAWNGLAGLHNGGNGSVVEFCEFDYNGWAGFSGNWSRGGMKVPNVTNMVIRRNYAHHNTGPGFWFDINAHDCLFEENLSEYNSWAGLVFELSCNCEIRNNVLRWNGLIPRGVTKQNPNGGLLWGVPLVIQNSEAANVHHNYFEAAPDEGARGGGVSIINQDRPQHTDGICGTHVTEKNYIHDNVMIMPRGGFNGLQYGRYGWETYADFLDSGNLWERNTYYTGAPTSGSFHWYSRGDSETEFIGAYHNWEDWQDIGQDEGSQFIGRHRSFFNKHNPELDVLIKATTGVGYDELKAPFLKPASDPDIDEDEDQMPTAWEVFHGLDPLIPDSDGDMDEDGLSNLEEYVAGTDPSFRDTDRDGMSDGWELQNGLNPLEADALGDPDGDNLVNLEEFEAGVSPIISTPLMGVFPNQGLTMWLKSNAALSMDASGQITPWSDWRDADGLEMSRPYNHRAPLVSEESIKGYPLLAFGPGDLKTRGGLAFGDVSSEGWTLVMALKPRLRNGPADAYALAGNSVWRESGFRLTVEQGYLRFYATQPGNRLSLRSFRKLQDESLVI
ncbi:MAG: right-handed parallel beta-helix repeat-containing protein, partial [Verrucomicrobiaceae bacterium]|nr:right-handed parallel beta-helix repeat-containing protein [Verrucomicrobiaceae bacterium]